jgi:hypothetical protein
MRRGAERRSDHMSLLCKLDYSSSTPQFARGLSWRAPEASIQTPRKKPEQVVFAGFFDGPPKPPATVELPVDFSSMPIGRVVSDDLRVIECPVCSLPCVAERRPKEWRFVHRGVIVSSAKRVKFEPGTSHSVESEVISALIRRGALSMTSHGTIRKTHGFAVSMIVEERARRAAMRKELGIE